jgi:protocatechuate 3,4-dioxygenase beta subunit
MPGDHFPRSRNRHPPPFTPAYRTYLTRSPRQPLLTVWQPRSETTGPLDNDLSRSYGRDGLPIGERILVRGGVRDENCRPAPHALVAIWEANARGRCRHVNDAHLAPLHANSGGCAPRRDHGRRQREPVFTLP